jgi:16S rRNA (uracil1498-N3)-methyltransferase
MYRFFVEPEQIGESEIIIKEGDVNHIKNVLRMKPGETILVSDKKNKEYVCVISEISDREVKADIVDINKESRELPIKVTLFQALPKGDKMENVIQKMVELGVYEIVPVSTKRCVVKLDDRKAETKTKRWNNIAESAAKQSKRGIIPKVHVPVAYNKALDMAKHKDIILIPYEEAENMQMTRQVISGIQPGMSVAIFIGPEGGFGREEVERALQIGAKDITLGKRILRTETAGMAVMSVLMYLMEE